MKKKVFIEKNVQRFATWVIVSRGEKHGERAEKEGKEKHFNGEKERYFLLFIRDFSLKIVQNLKMYILKLMQVSLIS